MSHETHKPLLIGLIGKKRSGKREAINLLRLWLSLGYHQLLHLSTSDFLIEALSTWKSIPPDREILQDYFTIMAARFGDDVLVNEFRYRIDTSHHCVIAYDCVRMEADVRLIRSYRRHLFLHIDAFQEIRYRRACEAALKPGGKADEADITLREFARNEQVKPTERRIDEFARLAHFRIDNNGDLAYLKDRMFRFCRKCVLPRLSCSA